jgi:hypothetical protein
MLCQIGPLSGDNGDMAISYYMFGNQGSEPAQDVPAKAGFALTNSLYRCLILLKRNVRAR